MTRRTPRQRSARARSIESRTVRRRGARASGNFVRLDRLRRRNREHERRCGGAPHRRALRRPLDRRRVSEPRCRAQRPNMASACRNGAALHHDSPTRRRDGASVDRAVLGSARGSRRAARLRHCDAIAVAQRFAARRSQDCRHSLSIRRDRGSSARVACGVGINVRRSSAPVLRSTRRPHSATTSQPSNAPRCSRRSYAVRPHARDARRSPSASARNGTPLPSLPGRRYRIAHDEGRRAFEATAEGARRPAAPYAWYATTARAKAVEIADARVLR